MLFKEVHHDQPVSDGVINLYLYNFGSNLGVAFVEGPVNLWVKRP